MPDGRVVSFCRWHDFRPWYERFAMTIRISQRIKGWQGKRKVYRW
jgi:hypothetical protein